MSSCLLVRNVHETRDSYTAVYEEPSIFVHSPNDLVPWSYASGLSQICVHIKSDVAQHILHLLHQLLVMHAIADHNNKKSVRKKMLVVKRGKEDANIIEKEYANIIDREERY